MGFDFRLDSDFFEHPKTEALADRCGDIAPLCLLRLWAFTTKFRSDGNLSEISDQRLEEKARWRGASGEFVGALVDIGWLDGGPNKRRLHDWKTHQKWVVGRGERKRVAKSNAQKRWEIDDAEPMPSASTTATAPQKTPASPSKPQQASEDPSKPAAGIELVSANEFVTTAEARDRCRGLGWEWPTELKLKTLRKVESVFPCSRHSFEAAVAETSAASPVDRVPYLAGTIANLEVKSTGPPKSAERLGREMAVKDLTAALEAAVGGK